MSIDFKSLSNDEILTRIKAFGIKSQGVSCTINNERYKVYDAEAIFNKHLVEKFSNHPCGELVLMYDDKLLMKTKDGMIKIKSFEKIQ